MTAASQPRWVKGSTTAVTMCRARKTTAVSARLRWRPVVRNRGQLGTSKRREDSTPSTTTALSSTSETGSGAPGGVPEDCVVQHRRGYEPPETATPVPDEEVTGEGEAWTPVEPVPEVEERAVPVLAVAPEETVVVPGIV